MGRNSCCVKPKLRKGLWSPEEDEKLYNYITRFGVGCWSSVPKLAGLQRCGKSCRLRWINYLRPDLKRGMFSQEEEDLIINLHEALGNRWAQIAAQLPGRTDNEIKNFWNSSLKKKLLKQGVDPSTHKLIKDERECADLSSTSLQIMQQEGFPTSSSAMQTNHLTTKFSIKQVYDPLFLSEFQSNLDSDGLNSNFLSHCQHDLLRAYEQSPISNPICGFNSMPNLTNFDHQNIPETQYFHHSSSRMSKFAVNEAKEEPNVSFQQAMMQMNNNGGGFSWEEESKLDSVFQFQFSGIQIEERNQKIPNQSSGDFAAYPLTNMNMLDHHRI